MDFSQIDEGHPDGEETLVFRYNREERLKRAPQIVQDYYNGKALQPKKGLFRVLLATRANRLMFITLCLLSVFVWINGFVNKDNTCKLNGVKVTLNAFSFKEQVYATVKFYDNNKKEYSFPVDVVFSALQESDTEGASYSSEPEIYSGKELCVRAQFKDYDIVKVKAQITSGEETKTLIAAVQRQ